MISIITSTHNGRKDKLEAAIKSVLEQTYQDYEMVIVDDASNDGTIDMVSPYLEKYPGKFKYIHRDECFGNDTRPKNQGIMDSSGEYIAFLDSDNTYRPDHLQALYQEIQRSNVDIVYGDRMLFGEVQGMGVFHDFEPYLLMRRNYIDTSDVLIKRDVLFSVGGFDERYKKYIDWNLWVRLAKAGYKFKHLPLVITNYYVGKDTKSARKEDEKSFSVPAWDAFECEIDVPHLHEVKEPKVAIFSLTMDRLEDTKTCFESMYKTAGYEFDHFVIDNGSKDETDGWLLDLEQQKPNKVYVELNDDNKGISIGSNQAIEFITDNTGFAGLQQKPYDIIVKVDPDALFLTDGWLAKMVDIWKSNHMFVMSPYIQGLKDNPGGAQRSEYGHIKGEIIGLTKHVGGIVCFADAKIYNNFRWDEHQTLHGVQDVEFSTYARMNGYQCCYLENYFVEHIGGTEGQHKKYPDYFKRREYEKTHAYGDKE